MVMVAFKVFLKDLVQNLMKDLLEALWKVEDRCDKAGNKLEVMERRMEALVYEPHDARRHVGQIFMEYDKAHGGPEVASRWGQDIATKWRNARSRLHEDASRLSWKAVVKGAVEDVAWQAESMAEKALKDMTALAKQGQEGSEAWVDLQATVKAASRWLENIRVNLKGVDILEAITDEEEVNLQGSLQQQQQAGWGL